MAIVNRDMLREDIKKGKITKETLYLAAPYEDKVASILISRDRALKMLKESMIKDYKKNGFVGYAFSKAQSLFTFGAQADLKVEINTDSKKSKIVLALPEYVITHCKDFFSDTYCPLPQGEMHGDVRTTLEEAIQGTRKLNPPESRRVRVVSNVPGGN